MLYLLLTSGADKKLLKDFVWAKTRVGIELMEVMDELMVFFSQPLLHCTPDTAIVGDFLLFRLN